MINFRVDRRGTFSIHQDDVGLLDTDLELHGHRPATTLSGTETCYVVEVQRSGGISPRAVLGASFTPSTADQVRFEVSYTENVTSDTFSGNIYPWPYNRELPRDYATTVLDELVSSKIPLPAGTLTVNRAGSDEIESSIWIFRKAASVLQCVFSAHFTEKDIEAAVTELAGHW